MKKARRRKAPTDRANRVDRLPPHLLEAEQGVLGCMLLEPAGTVPEVVSKNPCGAEVFYDLRHQTIYSTMERMSNKGENIDVITLMDKLAEKQQLEQIGGVPYLNSLQDAVPSAANVQYYLDIVKEKYQARRIVHTCTDVIGMVYDGDYDIHELQDRVEGEIIGLRDEGSNIEFRTAKQLVPSAVATIERMFQQKGEVSGLETGFTDLDKMTDGLHGGEMIVIAARPSMGKTSLAMNIAEHVSVSKKLPVGVFSLEMTSEQLITRMLASMARVNLRTIREGFMTESDFPRLQRAMDVMKDAPLYIDDTPGLSIMQLRARARRLWQQIGIKLFVIDYLQLLHSTSGRAKENRQQEISDISSGIKGLAKELKVPIIVLSQMNREFEKDKQRRPRLSDLRESGAIEQDADLVGLLYKPSSPEEDSPLTSTGEEYDGYAVNLLIAKQRNGPTGDVNLTFLRSFTRFESAAKVSNEDVPS